MVGAADLAAASLAVAVGPVAEALRGAGDELVMEFTKEDHEAVSAAIHEAEKRTCGQIVCVLAHSSSEYAYVPILWAIVLALLVPWPLIDFTQWTVQRIFLLQLMVFILAGVLFSWTPLRLALVPRPIQRARVHRAALEQFFVRRVTHTHNRCGILIFVSMAEHYARVIADEASPRKCIRGSGRPPSIRLLATFATVGSPQASSLQSNAAAQYLPRTLPPTVLPMSCQTACT